MQTKSHPSHKIQKIGNKPALRIARIQDFLNLIFPSLFQALSHFCLFTRKTISHLERGREFEFQTIMSPELP